MLFNFSITLSISQIRRVNRAWVLPHSFPEQFISISLSILQMGGLGREKLSDCPEQELESAPALGSSTLILNH